MQPMHLATISTELSAPMTCSLAMVAEVRMLARLHSTVWLPKLQRIGPMGSFPAETITNRTIDAGCCLTRLRTTLLVPITKTTMFLATQWPSLETHKGTLRTTRSNKLLRTATG